MKRLYIITGAKGHLAGTIIRCLRGTDCQIRGLILPTESGEDDRQVAYYHGDVTRPETLDALFFGAECNEVVVIHAAGLISISAKATPRLYHVNVEGTRNVLEQAMRHGVRKFVYVSSVHAIPELSDGEIITEVSRFSKDTVTGAYARTKAEATQAVLNAAAKGLNAVIVHPSGIIGPYDDGQNHLVQLIRLCVSGRLPACVAGGYDFVDVRDVARGCLLALDKGKAGDCYILSNRYYTVEELLSYVRETVGGRRKLCLPLGVARAFAPLFEWGAELSHTRPLYTRYALDTLASNGHFSHAKATAALGYQPRELRATVRDTVHWLQGKNVMLETA